jgi:alkylated DNA repair dioxygenase AlkB
VRNYEHRADHPLVIEGRSLLQATQGVLLEGCFLNGYEDKRDWLNWHEDDDAGIDHGKPIGVITVGQGRNIQFREVFEPRTETSKGVYGQAETLMLEPGSLLLMHAGMQQTHQHRIPKADAEVKPRISLTYRGLR